LIELDALNASKDTYNGTAVFGITVFADLSPAEFSAQYLGAVPPSKPSGGMVKATDVPVYQGAATSVDWTATLTTPIKNQGSCNFCW
jgi:hypothetical protein